MRLRGVQAKSSFFALGLSRVNEEDVMGMDGSIDGQEPMEFLKSAFAGDHIPDHIKQIPGTLAVQFVGVNPEVHNLHNWEHWIKGPIQHVFEEVRGKGETYHPCVFIGVADGVLIISLACVDKSMWIEAGRVVVKHCKEGTAKARWCILASDSWVLMMNPEEAEKDPGEGSRWIAEHGSLEKHPNSQECLMLHIEHRTPRGIQRDLLEFFYAVEGGQVNWIGDPHHCDPEKDGMGRMARPIMLE